MTAAQEARFSVASGSTKLLTVTIRLYHSQFVRSIAMQMGQNDQDENSFINQSYKLAFSLANENTPPLAFTNCRDLNF